VVAAEQLVAARRLIDEPSWVIGELVAGSSGVTLL
jgi:hypothetical protein